jgi:hypothetical protein
MRCLPLSALLVMTACATAREATAPTPSGDLATATSPGLESAPAEAERPDASAAAALRARLDSLPRCAPGAEVGQLTLSAGACTRKFCGAEACCNRCTWDARFETKGGPTPASKDTVRAVLALPEGALDCEVVAWSAALAGVSVGLDRGGCVVR